MLGTLSCQHCWLCWEVNRLVIMATDGQFLGDRSDTGGRERALRWRSTSATQWPASGGGYPPQQPSAWLNLPGSECCFLRMLMPPGSRCCGMFSGLLHV